MKSTAYLATFLLTLFIKIINGQHNGLVYNENIETNSPVSQQQHIRTYTLINNAPDILNQNGNTATSPNTANQHQILVQTNTPPSSTSTQQIQLPPDIQQQPLQVQQYLQLQQPLQLQQSPPVQLSVQLQPQSQTHTSLQVQTETHPPSLAIQPQDILQYQQQNEALPPQYLQISQLQAQQPSQSKQTAQSHNAIQSQQPSQQQQPVQPQQYLHTSQPSKLEYNLQAQDLSQALQPIIRLQPREFQQSSPQKTLTLSESTSFVETPVKQQRNNNQPNSQIQVKWKSSNPPVVMNVDKIHSTQNINGQLHQNSIKGPIEMFANAQFSDKPEEVTLPRYYIASPQLGIPPVSSITAPLVSNSQSFTIVPSNYIKPPEETYVPLLAPYNYIMPISELQLSGPERIKSVISIPASSSILAIPSPPTSNLNTQIPYYSRQASEYKQNANINQNSGKLSVAPEQTQFSVAIQSQPQTLIPSQSSILTSVPISLVQTPSVSPQYGVSTGYPVTIMPPAYINHKPKSSNLKSLLPLIFTLLRDKIASCDYKNNCPCDCKNNKSDNKLELATGYSTQKDYGAFNSDVVSILNNLSEEAEGREYLRETKDCEKIKNVSPETSDETLEEEEEESLEEEIDEDEEEIDE